MKTTERNIVVAAGIGLALIPGIARADVVWPSILIGQRLLTPFPILIGLAVEYLAVRAITPFRVPKAVFVTCLMNAVSSLVGIVAVPLIGIVWELFHSFVICIIFNTGTFNLFNWVANVLLAAATSASIEWLVIRFLFKTKIGKRGFGWLALANVASTALAFVLIVVDPPRM